MDIHTCHEEQLHIPLTLQGEQQGLSCRDRPAVFTGHPEVQLSSSSRSTHSQSVEMEPYVGNVCQRTAEKREKWSDITPI